MRAIRIILAVLALFMWSQAEARTHHRYRHHAMYAHGLGHVHHTGAHHWRHVPLPIQRPAGGWTPMGAIEEVARRGLVTVHTAVGIPITVASRVAERFQGLIADFEAAGYQPSRIHCFATHGHVRHSLHHIGEACDFNQRGWGKTDRFMHTALADHLIRKHGLRNGCQFRDCGHVDSGAIRVRFAWRSHKHHHRV
jgi:hypothetical protein